MKLHFLPVAAVLLAAGTTASHAQTFTPLITQTVGTGSEESFLTVDFHDGTADHNYAFGYKYDGAKTGADMVAALNSDSSLKVGYVPGFSPTDGGSLYGVAVNSFAFGSHYEAGFENAYYWSYWLGNDGQNWNYSGVGASGRDLSNGSWDGWSWDVNGTPNGGPVDHPPLTPAAVPEASSVVSLGLLLGFGVIVLRRKKTTS